MHPDQILFPGLARRAQDTQLSVCSGRPVSDELLYPPQLSTRLVQRAGEIQSDPLQVHARQTYQLRNRRLDLFKPAAEVIESHFDVPVRLNLESAQAGLRFPNGVQSDQVQSASPTSQSIEPG